MHCQLLPSFKAINCDSCFKCLLATVFICSDILNRYTNKCYLVNIKKIDLYIEGRISILKQLLCKHFHFDQQFKQPPRQKHSHTVVHLRKKFTFLFGRRTGSQSHFRTARARKCKTESC